MDLIGGDDQNLGHDLPHQLLEPASLHQRRVARHAFCPPKPKEVLALRALGQSVLRGVGIGRISR
jgi:hypothetical protein